MTYLLDCTTPSQKYRWVLRNGEEARVGCSPWVEFHIENELDILPVHLQISYTNRLVLHALEGASMDVNGARLAIATICSGTDVKIGNCEIHFAQMFASVPLSVSISPEPNSAIKRNDAWENKREIIDNVSLSHEGIAAIESFHRPLAAVEHLSSISLLEDAIRLLAGTLPVYSLIQWVFQAFCHHEVGNEACRTETQRWLNEPTEERRLEIANHVPWNETSCPWTWVLAAISWTSTMHDPCDQAVTVATPKMIVSAMIAALQLASCQKGIRSFREYCVAEGIQFLTSANGMDCNRATRSST